MEDQGVLCLCLGSVFGKKKKDYGIFRAKQKHICTSYTRSLLLGTSAVPRTITMFDVISITFIFTILLVWPRREKVPGSIFVLPEFKVCTKFFGVWSHASFLSIICVYENQGWKPSQ